LHGQKDGSFTEPKPVLDKSGDVLRLGQFWDYGNKKWAKTEDFLGISAFPIDWDNDGDFDLLLGANGGRVFLRLNEGTKQEPAFATSNVAVRASGEDLSVPGGHAMPVAVDWDGDGLFDLVSGSNNGAVHWFRNTGKPGAPAFAAAKMLVSAAAGDAPHLGQRTQVAVADYNGDGRMDLLIGDYRSAAPRDNKKRAYHGWVWLALRTPAK
jgi:hypothetical protein